MKTHEAIIFLLSPIILGFGALHSYTIISREMPHLLPPEPYPGDKVIPDAVMVYDQTELIHAPPEAVWPWVLQVGKGRGGCKSLELHVVRVCDLEAFLMIRDGYRVCTELVRENPTTTRSRKPDCARRIPNRQSRRHRPGLRIQRRGLLYRRRDPTESRTGIQVRSLRRALLLVSKSSIPLCSG
jgi:hypothetical protein